MIGFVKFNLLVGISTSGRADLVISLASRLSLESFLELTTWLLTAVENQWDQEDHKAEAWNKCTQSLPALVVSTVWINGVSFNCHNQEGPKSPWDDKLNGEAEPELEDLL